MFVGRSDTHRHTHTFAQIWRFILCGFLYAFVTFQWHAQHHQKLCPSFVPFFGEHLAADLAKSQALRLCGRLLWRPRRSAFMSSHSLLLRIPSCPMMFHYVSPLSAEYFSVCNVPCLSLILVSLSLSHSAQEALLDPVQRAAAQSAASTSFKAPKAGTATMDCTAWTPTYDLCQKHSKAIVMLCSVPHYVL